jgi:hypothetical protein
MTEQDHAQGQEAPLANAGLLIGPAPDVRPSGDRSGSSPLARPYAVARCLAGFMTADSALAHVPKIQGLPGDIARALEQRYGRSALLPPVPGAGQPQFTAVTEPSVLQLLEIAAAESAIQASLENLVGFEWVEIAPIIAGRLLASEPWPESLPAELNQDIVARYCALSCAVIPEVQQIQGPDGAPAVAFPVTVTAIQRPGFGIGGVEINGVQHIVVNVQHILRPAVDPIRVLVAEGRTIALTGLGRLAALLERGVTRALCSVSYGYGQDAVMAPTTVPDALLFGARPPLISDLLDQQLTVHIPTRPEPGVTLRFPLERSTA